MMMIWKTEKEKVLLDKALSADDEDVEDDQFVQELGLNEVSDSDGDEGAGALDDDDDENDDDENDDDDDDDEEEEEDDDMEDGEGDEDDADEENDDDQIQLDDSDEDDYDASTARLKIKPKDRRDITSWGKEKQDYYNANISVSEVKKLTEKEREAIQLEEDEARRLNASRRKAMTVNDFLPVDFAQDVKKKKKNDQKDTSTATATPTKTKAENKMLSQLNRKLEQVDVAEPSTPVVSSTEAAPGQTRIRISEEDNKELTRLLDELYSRLSDVRNQIQPLLKRGKAEKAHQGMSFLDAKLHLMLSYILDLVFYFFLKLSGRRIAEHPVISQLAEIRVLLDKMRPIDKKLRYQIDRLVKMATNPSTQLNSTEVDPLRFKPLPGNLVSKLEAPVNAKKGGAASGEPAKYVPPKIAAVPYETKELLREKADKEAKKMARRSHSLAADLRAEITGQPDTEYSVGAELSTSKPNKSKKTFSDELDNYEEETFTRLQLSKKAKQMIRQDAEQRYTDELSELTKIGGDLISRVEKSAAKRDKLHQQLEQGGNSLDVLSDDAGGDSDSESPAARPPKKPLSRYIEMIDSKERSRNPAGGQNPELTVDFSKRQRGSDVLMDLENEFAAKEAAERAAGSGDNPRKRKGPRDVQQSIKKRAKQDARLFESGNSRRTVSRDIENNRGLRTHRHKEASNPRVRQKSRFDKAQRKRQSSGIKEFKPAAGAYEGERAIRKNVVRSTTL